jgi:hypothetical protein
MDHCLQEREALPDETKNTMAWWWIVWMALVLLGSAQGLYAQTVPAEPAWGTFRDTIDAFTPPPYRIQSFVLSDSETVYLNGRRLDRGDYRIDYRHGRIWIERDRLQTDDELVVVYRTYPFRFAPVYRRRSVDSTQSEQDGSTPRRAVVEDATASPDSRPSNALPGFQLERSGSISRGVIAGNNRDVNIESGLRMQLAGAVAENINIQAVLTDSNTPIQPDGTTQRLDNFDRVYMQVDAPPGTAQLGDIEVEYDGSTFTPFVRKLQGASVSTADVGTGVPGLTSGRVRAVGATTRGQYRSQDIEPIDGVQGPYRLEGAEGERFIVVIAGSERVYLDGERLTRGQTNDYVIDYALAEITFTANRLITDDRRITVEFEYTTTGFNRTLVGADAEVGLGGRVGEASRVQVGATFLREADDRTFSNALDLSPQDSLLLQSAGDAGVARSGAEVVRFDPEAPYVQYRREVRPNPDGMADTVFVALDAAPADTATVYRVRFSRVGTGAGRYERAGRSVNGIVYAYRGAGEGDYEPIQRLPQPIRRQVMDVRGRVRVLPNVEVAGEWAGSFNDQNRFSALDQEDDRGQAYEAALRVTSVPLEGDSWSLGTVSATARRRTTGRYFSSFNRTRPVEFGRRWNLAVRGFDPTTINRGNETINEAQVEWAFTPQSRVELSGGRLELGSSFTAWRQQADLEWAEGTGWPTVEYAIEHIASTDATERVEGTWLRQRGVVRQPFGVWTPRVTVEQEMRRQRVVGTDSLARGSLAFVDVRPGIDVEAGALTAGTEVVYRTEREGIAGALRDASQAWTVQSNLKYSPNSTFKTEGRIGVRSRRVAEHLRINRQQGNQESVLLRWTGTARPFGRALEIDGLYDALTERMPTQQEIYVRTGPELGQYVWTDSNDDGIIQVDEFVPETTPNEGTYVQRFVPSDSLTPVVNLQARLRIHADPARRWRGATAWWKQALTTLSTRTTLELQEKSRSNDLAAIYVLDQSAFRQKGVTLDGQVRVRQDVYFFRRRSAYGLDVSFDQVRGLSERAAGLQTRYRRVWQAEAQYRFNAVWSAQLMAAHRVDRSASQAFASRSYAIDGFEVQPEVTMQLGSMGRLVSGWSYGQKNDAVGPRSVRLFRVPIELQWTRAERFELTGRVECADIRLDGDAAGLARFELTDGRGPGTSYLWHLSGQYRFSNQLRATFSYDGRAPAGAPTINSVRLQMSASF